MKEKNRKRHASRASAGKTYPSCTSNSDDQIVFAGFDLETRGLGGELLMIQCSIMGNITTYSGDGMIERFMGYLNRYPNPVIWYAFNASYEWRYLLGHIIEHYEQIEIGMRTDTDIYRVSYFDQTLGNSIEMRDAAALFPMGTRLEDFANAFCPEFPKLSIDIANFDVSNPAHIEYAQRDVEILTRGLPSFNAILMREFNVSIGHTAAGTAMRAWESTLCDIFPCSNDDAREEYIRSGYFGGLVFLTSNELQVSIGDKPAAITYDINSSYPSVMLDYGVPSGKTFSTLEYNSELYGIYTVLVRAPQNLRIPILPSRNVAGNMVWRGGQFETTVTNRELVFAIANGYELLDIKSGFLFDSISYPFQDFITKCKRIRREHPKTPLELVAKLMQNSLYGKFASKRDRLQVFIPEDDSDLVDAKRCLNEDLNLWLKTEHSETMRCKPEWSVFITANARLKLLETAYRVGVENVLYGDTDSLTVSANADVSLIPQSANYGDFKIEKVWREYRAIAPKIYAGILQDGRYSGAAKGLPRRGISDSTWQELLLTGESYAESLSLNSLRVGLEKGMKPAEIKGRVSGSLENSSNFLLHDGKISIKIAS